MQRYFIKDDCFKDDLVIISGNDFHHIKHVMRLKVGDEIIVNSFTGNVFKATITSFDKHELTARINSKLEQEKSFINITLAQSLIKKDHFELVLQKATELGARAIIPLEAKRSIVKINDADKKKERFKMILKEASEQSERVYMPILRDISDVYHLPFQEFDHVIVAYAREDRNLTLSNVIEKTSKDQNILILVGPEGGFTIEELDFLKEKAHFVSLGNTILRSETAAIYMLSAFRYAWEN